MVGGWVGGGGGWGGGGGRRGRVASGGVDWCQLRTRGRVSKGQPYVYITELCLLTLQLCVMPAPPLSSAPPRHTKTHLLPTPHRPLHTNTYKHSSGRACFVAFYTHTTHTHTAPRPPSLAVRRWVAWWPRPRRSSSSRAPWSWAARGGAGGGGEGRGCGGRVGEVRSEYGSIGRGGGGGHE